MRAKNTSVIVYRRRAKRLRRIVMDRIYITRYTVANILGFKYQSLVEDCVSKKEVYRWNSENHIKTLRITGFDLFKWKYLQYLIAGSVLIPFFRLYFLFIKGKWKKKQIVEFFMIKFIYFLIFCAERWFCGWPYRAIWRYLMILLCFAWGTFCSLPRGWTFIIG